MLSRRGLRTPFLRIAKGGTVRPASDYTRSGGAGADIADQVADDRVLDLLADGNTLVLQGLHRIWPALVDFAAALRTDLGHPVQINSYLTPRAAQGFAHHYDVHDVFVLQVVGTKHWQIHAPVHPDPLRSQPWTDRRGEVERVSAAEPLIDTVLEPGDVLYLPRGYVHGARAQDGISLHLTVGIHPVTRYSIVESLLAEASAAPGLRTSLPLGADLDRPDEVAGYLRETIAELTSWLDQLDPTVAADRLRQRTWRQNRPAPLPPLAQLQALSDLTSASRLGLREHLELHCRPVDSGIRLETVTGHLDVPAEVGPTIDALRAGQQVTVAALPGGDEQTRIDLARRLLRAGIAVPAG